jgi:integrase
VAGVDPLDQREAERATATTAKAKATTFTEVAERYVRAHEPGWRNPKHRQQWRNTLATYVEPVIGRLPVGAVTTDHILEILEPVWTSKPETASRVRGRIEVILSYAIARGWRDGPNPALWRGHLQTMLPAKGKVHRVEHHAALPWREAPDFMRRLRQQAGIGARALEFAILTGARSNEVRGATWDEIDEALAIWCIPAARMKKGDKPHKVPLSKPALAVLKAMRLVRREGGLVFPGQDLEHPMSDMTLTAVLRRMDLGHLTQHGFRSTFRDWVADETSYQNHVAEMALSHKIGSAVEAAYRRGDLFGQRMSLMDDWAQFLAPALRPAPRLLPGHRAAG